MTTCRPKKLQAVSLPGLTLDTLGLYFAALGLLRLLSRQWPQVRGCWRNGVFTVIGENISPERLFDFLLSLKGDLSDFKISWKQEAEESAKNVRSKAFTGDTPTAPLLNFRSRCDEDTVPMFDMHLVANRRTTGNPLFKNPGGKRKPHDKWKDLLNDAFDTRNGRKSLKAVLLKEIEGELNLDKWNAGSWFPSANKIYNFSGYSFSISKRGTTPYADNGIPSWGVVLAVNGFYFVSGSCSRKIGANSQGIASFPFTTIAAAPVSSDECGKSEGEFWAPVWKRPLTNQEISFLFSRAKAEIGTKSATSSSSFSAALITRGVDHGLSEFRRFEFRYSTGDKTFEAVQTARLRVSTQRDFPSAALIQICKMRDALPRETKVGGRWRFKGLQGPLDRALLDLAQAVGEGKEERQVEAALAVLDTQFAALAKVNRNKAHRESKVAFERLPLDFFAWLAKSEGGSAEFRLALAIASMRSEIPAAITKPDERIRLPQALLAYRLGATGRGRFWSIPKDRPLRAVWSPRDLIDNLCALARRRIIESPASGIAPFRSHFPAPVSDIAAFLRGETDDALLARWIDRLSLFDWKYDRELRDNLNPDDSSMAAWSSETALYAYFRPLLHDELLRGLQKQISSENRYLKRGDDKPLLDRWAKRKCDPLLATATRISSVLAALERDETAAAWASAKSVFHTARIPIADFGPDTHFSCDDPRRLLAALIIPAQTTGLYDYFRKHWTAPSQPKPNHEAAKSFYHEIRN